MWHLADLRKLLRKCVLVSPARSIAIDYITLDVIYSIYGLSDKMERVIRSASFEGLVLTGLSRSTGNWVVEHMGEFLQ